MKIVRSAAVVVLVLGVAGAGYEDAARDQEMNPAAWNLAANWRTDDGRTWIDLRPDGKFRASGISNCIGPISLYDPGTQQMTPPTNVADGAGTWNYGPYDSSTVEDGLVMQFGAPYRLPLSWVVDRVEWRSHPVSVTMTVNGEPTANGEPRVIMCTLHSH